MDTECKNVKYCETCEGDICNKLSKKTLQTYTKCHRCLSSDPKCINGTTEATDCDRREDTCYSRIYSKFLIHEYYAIHVHNPILDNLLERNCLSILNQTDQAVCKLQNDTTCITCSNANGCNTENWLRCHQCKETADATCAAQQTDASRAQFCKNYKDGNRCYERLESSKVVRGCETDLGTNKDPCEGNTQCRSCTNDACNKEAASTLESTDRCLQCRTDQDPAGSCLTGAAQAQPCARESGEECYSRIVEGRLYNADFERNTKMCL